MRLFRIGIGIIVLLCWKAPNAATQAPVVLCAYPVTPITVIPPAFSQTPAINAAGTRLVFESNADPTGGNSDGNSEIFLFDTITGAVTQITTTLTFSQTPTINATGTRLAFRSSADLLGHNPDGNNELFLFDTSTGAVSQITATTVAFNQLPSLNAAGTLLAFQSSADFTGENPDGNGEIFLFATTAETMTQVTTTASGGSFAPTLNAAGTRIAFQSSADLTGGNPDGNDEMFLLDIPTGTMTQVTTTTNAFNQAPALNAAGTRLAFQSNADLTGGNPDGNSEIFLLDTMTGGIIQMTTSPTGNSLEPAIDASGVRLAFVSDADLSGSNPDGNSEIFLLDTALGTLTQITMTSEGFNSTPAINADGTRVAFVSSADSMGETRQVLLAHCQPTAGPYRHPNLQEAPAVRPVRTGQHLPPRKE